MLGAWAGKKSSGDRWVEHGFLSRLEPLTPEAETADATPGQLHLPQL